MLDNSGLFETITIEDFSKKALAQLQQLEADLLMLPVNHDTEQINRLIETAHLLKNGVASLGWPSLETLAFSLSNTLNFCGQEALEIDQDLHKLLLQAYFCLRIPLLVQLQLGQYDILPALARAKLVYSQLTHKLGHNLEENSLMHVSQSSAAINGKLLTIGLNQWMKELETIISQPDCSELGRLLVMKATILENMGDYFGFPGISLVGRNMLRALESSSQGSLSIAHQALRMLRQAQDWASVSEPMVNESDESTFTVTVEVDSSETNTLLPLTSTAQAGIKRFYCLVDSVVLALPFQNIAEIFSPQIDKIKQIGNQRFIYWKGRMLLMHRLLSLVTWLSLPSSTQSRQNSVLVFQQENQFLALELNIERLINSTNLMIQPLSINRPFCLGSTLLTENRLTFVIDGLAAINQKITEGF